MIKKTTPPGLYKKLKYDIHGGDGYWRMEAQKNEAPILPRIFVFFKKKRDSFSNLILT